MYPALTGNAFFPRASACDDKKWGENFSSPEWDTFGRVTEYLFLLFEDVLVNRRLVDAIDTNIYEIFLELVSNRYTVNVFIPWNGDIHVYAVKPSMKLS